MDPRRPLLIGSLLALSATGALRAQELEPRAYSSSPIGTNFFAAVAGKTRGSILFDPAIPLTDVHADLSLVTLGYGRTFAIGGRQALVTVAVPYVWGEVEGMVEEEAGRVHRSGLADSRLKLSVNLLGPKAMSVEEFRTAPRRTILGVSLAVQAPSGQYDGMKLINLGTNRFAFKPEVGVSVPVGRWFLDAYAGIWFFETNDDFFPGGSTRRQDPLVTLQGHASYTFQNRAWIALDATWYGGGRSTVDTNPPTERQSNSRFGGTFSLPITPKQSLKLAASIGGSTRTGSDFDTVVAGWQITWFDR